MATMASAGLLSPLHCHLSELPLLGSSSIRNKLAEFRFCQPNIALKHARNASIVPVVRAQSSSGYVPDSKFYKVEAILRPWRVSQVSSALLKIGIRGVTVSDVRGFGAQGGSTERHGGSEFSEDNFVAKIKMEIVVSKDQVEAVVDTIIEAAKTGEIGDGKILWCQSQM
nr:nitrogen regulatory protein P-II homolog [Malus domestica]